MKRYIVIGLGNFGFYVAKTLYEDGHEVLAIDRNRDRVARIQDLVSEAMILDAIHRESLKGLGIAAAEAVVVSMGDDISNSILTTLYLKELGAKKIVVKCQDEDHGRILEKLGANEIIFPEKAMGQKVAKGLSRGNILDFIPLSEDYTIIETAAPKEFLGKSLEGVETENHLPGVRHRRQSIDSAGLHPLPARRLRHQGLGRPGAAGERKGYPADQRPGHLIITD